MSAPAWNLYARDCPSRQLLDLIGDRWTVLVVGTLADGPLRFSAIAHAVDGISQKMLTQTLRRLEAAALVTRTQYPEIPPRVEYELTEAGHTLREPLRALKAWAIEHLSDGTALAAPR